MRLRIGSRVLPLSYLQARQNSGVEGFARDDDQRKATQQAS